VQQFQLFRVLGRQQIGPHRENLSELQERHAQVLERLKDRPRRRKVLRPSDGAEHLAPFENTRDLPQPGRHVP